MAKTPEVLVVAQTPQVRVEVKRLLKQSQFALAGEAGFGTDAVSLAMETRPDVIICGMDDPPTRSIQTIYALVNALPETAAIVSASPPPQAAGGPEARGGCPRGPSSCKSPRTGGSGTSRIWVSRMCSAVPPARRRRAS